MSNEVSKVQSNASVPAFMQNQEVMGTEALNAYVRPPRLKLVQAMSRAPFDQYDQGTVLVVPQLIEFAKVDRATKKGDKWKFIPLFFYPEWIQTNPMALANAPFIRERSFDPRSELARKARTKETWFEPCPEDPKLQIANRECLNFVVMPYDHPTLSGTMCVLTFARANFRDGSNLASMIKIRKAPIFGQVFEASAAQRENAKGAWWGLNISIPEDTPWAGVEDFEVFKALHLELAKTHEEGLLQVDYDDTEESQTATSTEF